MHPEVPRVNRADLSSSHPVASFIPALLVFHCSDWKVKVPNFLSSTGVGSSLEKAFWALSSGVRRLL